MDLQVDLLPNNHTNGHFFIQKWPKLALNSQNVHFFILILHYPASRVSSYLVMPFEYPVNWDLLSAYSLKLRIYELIYYIINLKVAISQPKKMAKTSIFHIFILHYPALEYQVNMDALIL